MAVRTVYKLYRIEGAGRTEVGTFKSLGEGFSAGQDAVHADAEHVYALYSEADGAAPRRVARFGFSRLEASAQADTTLAGLVLS